LKSVDMVFLPCLRCGLDFVPVSFLLLMNPRSTIMCHRCEAEHYLSIQKTANGYEVDYQLYTLRYPLESYDEGLDIPVSRYEMKDFGDPPETHGGPGPIIVYLRKKRFSIKEVTVIWEASKGKCHICGRIWKLNERGIRGWHIDHVVPHVGGGQGTEAIENLRLACAKCNLKKGRGYTEKRIRLAIRDLVQWVDSRTVQMNKFRGGRGESF